MNSHIRAEDIPVIHSKKKKVTNKAEEEEGEAERALEEARAMHFQIGLGPPLCQMLIMNSMVGGGGAWDGYNIYHLIRYLIVPDDPPPRYRHLPATETNTQARFSSIRHIFTTRSNY